MPMAQKKIEAPTGPLPKRRKLIDPILERVTREGKILGNPLAEINVKLPWRAESKFFVAVHKGNVEEMRSLLGNGFDVNLRNEADSMTALMFAAKYGHPGMIGLLIDSKADVHLKDLTGNTAFHLVIKCNHIDCARPLLYAGSDINTTDNRSLTPLITAIYASTDGNVAAIKFLCESKSLNVNYIDNYGRTALMDAAGRGQSQIVEMLLKQGADMSLKDNWGQDALGRVRKAIARHRGYPSATGTEHKTGHEEVAKLLTMHASQSATRK